MTPVQYTTASKKIVDAFEALPENQQSGDYWSDDNVTGVRGEIKTHYIAEQQYRCIYCARQIVTKNMSLWDAEHVISRARAARFMFKPENLGVSCRDCNIAKGEQEIRRNPERKSFPNGSEHYRIVHPHYDNYDEHIRWFGEICAPLSEKGQNTLFVCKLSRFTATLLGVDGIVTDPAFDRLIGQLVKAKTKIEMLAIVAALKVYVESIPQS